MTELSCGHLMGKIQALLLDLASHCHDIEATSLVHLPDGTAPATPSHKIMALQQLDLMAQSLTDLAGLAGRLADSRLADQPLDPQIVRQTMRLTSLADRLLGTEADTADAAEFLL